MKTHTKFTPDYAIPPGETLLETIEELSITPKELSLRMDLSLDSINQLINGDIFLNREITLKLEEITGVEATFWSSLESQYRKTSTDNHKSDIMN